MIGMKSPGLDGGYGGYVPRPGPALGGERSHLTTFAGRAVSQGCHRSGPPVGGHIANHTNQDNSPAKMVVLEKRKAGDPHPYVVGTDSIRRYLKVAEECARAGALRQK
jgi:hypothetical protein